jgi:hypothetical protein
MTEWMERIRTRRSLARQEGGVMTEWNGIKVGSIYKRTGKGSDGAPLALVVAIEEWFDGPPHLDDGVELTTLEGGLIFATLLNTQDGRKRINDGDDKWPYKEVV